MKNKVLPVLFLVLAVGLTAWAAGQAQDSKTAVDPVCGMSVAKDGAKWTYDYKGTTYYFCSEGCKTSFAKEPEKYLAKTVEAGKAAAGTMGHGAMMGEKMAKQGGMQMQGQKPQMQSHPGMEGETMPHMQGGMMDGMMAHQHMMMDRHMMMGMRPGRMGMMGMGMRPGMRMPMRPGMMGGMMGGAFGFGPMMMDGVDKKIENTKDGVVVTLSSKDPEIVKMIQDSLARMLEREKMMKAMDEAKKK